MELANMITPEGVRDVLLMGRWSDQIKLSVEKAETMKATTHQPHFTLL